MSSNTRSQWAQSQYINTSKFRITLYNLDLPLGIYNVQGVDKSTDLFFP